MPVHQSQSCPIRRCSAGSDLLAVTQGLDSLYGLRSWLPEPDLIDVMLDPDYRLPVCRWIGENIVHLNASLSELLEDCQACLLPSLRPQVKLFAAPLAARFGLDGVCCLPVAGSGLESIPIILDLGTLEPPYWLSLLVHEYAHALSARPGHDLQFQQWLSMLCRALDLDLPQSDSNWNSLPAYPRRLDRLAFWMGATSPC